MLQEKKDTKNYPQEKSAFFTMKIEITVSKKKKIIKAYGVRSFETGKANIKDLFIYFDPNSVDEHNANLEKKRHKMSCFFIDSSLKPKVIEGHNTTLGFEFTDDEFFDYAR